jgi:hypothetical protein
VQTRGSYNLRSVSPAFSSLSLNANLQCAALLALAFRCSRKSRVSLT